MDVKIWNGYGLSEALQLRTDSLDTIEKRQHQLLLDHISQAATVPYYQSVLQDLLGEASKGWDLAELLYSLPFTSRADLDTYHDRFGVTGEFSIQDVALTSGTTGTSVVVPYTESDLQRLAYNEAISFYRAGVGKGSRVLLTVTLDRCFIAGLAYYSGVIALGATAIRSGPGQPARQWELIDRLRPDVIVGVPTFMLELGRWGGSNSFDVSGCPVKKIITIGEPSRKHDFSLTPVGAEIEEIWQAKIFSSYGATEFETAFGECSAGAGGHVHPELMIAEVIDEDGRVLPDGEAGEVVVTPLGVQGFPLIRFRTGDIARLYSEPCSCGWTTKRLGPIEGRLAQRLKYRGTTLYPESIFHVLQNVEGVTASYVEVRSRADGADDVCVVIGADRGLDSAHIEALLQARLRVTPDVTIREVGEVKKVMSGSGGHKPKKFFDFRN